jgi:hypothetical protein
MKLKINIPFNQIRNPFLPRIEYGAGSDPLPHSGEGSPKINSVEKTLPSPGGRGIEGRGK